MAAGLLQRAANEINFKAAHLIVEIYPASKILYRPDAGPFFGNNGDWLRVADFRAQTLTRHLIMRRNHYRALNRILEFTNVTRPGVSLKQRQDVWSDLLRYFAAILFVVLFDKMLGQRQNVLAPVAQGRQLDRNNRQPVIEIFAKCSLLDRFFQLDVGGGDDAHIDPTRASVAERRKFALLNYAQQTDLRFRWNVSYLIKKY